LFQRNEESITPTNQVFLFFYSRCITFVFDFVTDMSRFKDFYNKNFGWINAYWLVFFIFVILTFSVGDSSLYKRYTYNEKIRTLENEIDHYENDIQVNSKKLHDLHTDKDGLERFAREEYFMKRDSEDIFLIKEK